MKSVTEDEGRLELDLAAGRLRCPACRGPLRRWGWARPRTIRTVDGRTTVQPRRARCGRCGGTHVLLADWMLARRADSVEVIGAALVAHSRAIGYRRIARAIHRPPTTVRDWLRRWAIRARDVTAALGGVARSAYGAVCVIYAAAASAGLATAPWRYAARHTDGRVLASRNTNPPHRSLSGVGAGRRAKR